VYPNSWRILALDELGKITLAAHRDHRTVITDANSDAPTMPSIR